MRPIQIITPSYPTADPNYLATSQTPLAAGNLTLVANTISPPSYVTITSAGNDSGRTFTVAGLGPNGQSQATSFAGANIGAATAPLAFSYVESIAVDDATAGAVEAGLAQSGYSAWIPLDIYVPNQVTTISATVTGTVNYSIECTNEDPFDNTITQTAVAHPVAALTGASASQTGSTTTLMRAVRYKINSGSGTLRLTIVQQSTA